MFNDFAVTTNFSLKINKPTPNLTPELDNIVTDIWQAQPRQMHNGLIFSAIVLKTTEIIGCAQPYCRFIAQRVRPELFNLLGVRPVAVTGFLECLDGVVVGLRAKNVTQDPGVWELVPSGSIDVVDKTLPTEIEESVIGSKGSEMMTVAELDFRAQILRELHEETGLEKDFCGNLQSQPFCVIEDLKSHVIDIGILLRANIPFSYIQEKFNSLPNVEYEQLALVPFNQLGDAVKKDNFAKVAKILFNYRQYLDNMPNTSNFNQ